jgi:hypothetical protein
MKTFFRNTSAIALMAFASLASLAAGPLSGVAGYDPAQGGNTITLAASSVTGNAYTITVSGMIGVSFDGLKGQKPYNVATDAPTKKQVSLYNLPNGTMVYAMGLGRDWGNMSEELNAIDVAKAKASGKIIINKLPNGQSDNGTVMLQFQKGDERCRTVTWVAVLPDGQRAWGGHPEDGWSTNNVNGSPMTGWCFEGSKVVRLDEATKTALAQKK